MLHDFVSDQQNCLHVTTCIKYQNASLDGSSHLDNMDIEYIQQILLICNLSIQNLLEKN